jgi:hypothetical protein
MGTGVHRSFPAINRLLTKALQRTALWTRGFCHLPPKKFEFVIILRAAKQIGLTIPPNVLVQGGIK